LGKQIVGKGLFFDRCCVCGRVIHWTEIVEDDRGNVYCKEHAPSNGGSQYEKTG